MKTPVASYIHSVVIAIMLLLALPALSETAEPPAGKGPPVATLSVLAGPVHYLAAGSRHKQGARNGVDLVIGDRVITGENATALITFLDGTTVTVQPESEIAISKAESSNGKNTRVNILLGTVWARVVHALAPRSTFSLAANAATATVHDAMVAGHDSLIGARVNPNGSFDCWTRSGVLHVRDDDGQRYVTLMPGEKTKVELGKFNARFGFRLDPDPVAQPFSVNQSMLRITTSSSVFPLVFTEDKMHAAGFMGPNGAVLNYVFGSYTGAPQASEFVVEVPAGVVGPFALFLEGARDDAYHVTIAGLYNGEQVYVQKLSGTIRKGERVSLEITQQLDPELESYPTMARIVGSRVAPLGQMRSAGQTLLHGVSR